MIEGLLMPLSFPDYCPCSKMRSLEQVGSVGSAFLTSSKVAIYKDFYWGISKISKEVM